jgi:hypothetical protein
MGTYIPYSFYAQWQAGFGDQLALAIYGRPGRYTVSWGDGSAGAYRQDQDLNGDGIGDIALAAHRYANDGLYNIAIRPVPGDDLPPRLLRAHVHAHADTGVRAVGNDRDEMFLMSDHADTVRTGNGVNWVSAGGGNDNVVGGNGTDVIDGGAGDDMLRGGGGQDQLFGGDGADVLRGSGGLDLLDGGAGDDRLYAEGNANYLVGGDGRDRLFGGDGSDVLDGGAGVDRLTGGASGDIFTFRADGPERDVITDWSNEGPYSPDYMDVSDWGDGMRFIGTGLFSGATGEVRYVRAASTTIVLADVDGDKVADFSIALVGSFALTSADFLL